MKRTNSMVLIISSFIVLLACNGLTNPTTEFDTTSVTEPTVAESLATKSIAAMPVPTEPATEAHIAYVQNDTLKVTHVIGGKAIDTQEYATSQLRGGIYNVGWSPSGEYLTFTMFVNSFGHLFIVNVTDGSAPLDLGIANDWAWSADSKLLAFEHEYELWVFSPQSGESKALTIHLGTDWLWYTPAFTPSGDALIAAGISGDTLDIHGNSVYRLYRIPLDGSAANAYPPENLTSITEQISGPRPLALRFSADGTKMAITSTVYSDRCASDTRYYIANADGSDLHPVSIPSLAGFENAAEKIFFLGDSLVWTHQSDGFWINGWVRDCTEINGMIAGPQISHMTLDGQEQAILPGTYNHLSLDPTGTLLGVVKRLIPTPHVQILGLDGHLVIDLGEGDHAAMKP
jgi:hypothetical protein